LPVQKEIEWHNVYFVYKGNCKGSQKEDENVESCTRVNAHSQGKAAFLLYTNNVAYGIF
jgi:hypothetical protein